jgi:hypothetical protein
VELGERKSGPQFEAARALLLRDGEGGLKGLFSRPVIIGIRLQ